jgi:hypothetical protein
LRSAIRRLARGIFRVTPVLLGAVALAFSLLVIPSSSVAAATTCDPATSQTLCPTTVHLSAVRSQKGGVVVVTGKVTPATHDGQVVLYQVQKASDMQLGTGVFVRANGTFTIRESLSDGGRLGTAVYLVEYNPTGSYSPSQAKINIHVSR